MSALRRHSSLVRVHRWQYVDGTTVRASPSCMLVAMASRVSAAAHPSHHPMPAHTHHRTRSPRCPFCCSATSFVARTPQDPASSGLSTVLSDGGASQRLGDSAGSVACAAVMGLYAAVSQMVALGAPMRRQGAAKPHPEHSLCRPSMYGPRTDVRVA